MDPKLIDFIQLSENELYKKIARRLENDSIFRDFTAESGDFNSYAVAAGLITEAERKWLANEENPYKSQDGKVWYTGTASESDGYWRANLTETADAKTSEFLEDYSSIDVNILDKYLFIVNGHPMEFSGEETGYLYFYDPQYTDGNITLWFSWSYPPFDGHIDADLSKGLSENIEVVVVENNL